MFVDLVDGLVDVQLIDEDVGERGDHRVDVDDIHRRDLLRAHLWLLRRSAGAPPNAARAASDPRSILPLRSFGSSLTMRTCSGTAKAGARFAYSARSCSSVCAAPRPSTQNATSTRPRMLFGPAATATSLTPSISRNRAS